MTHEPDRLVPRHGPPGPLGRRAMTPTAGRIPPRSPSPKGQHVNMALINNNGTLTTVSDGAGREVGLSPSGAADDLGITRYGHYE